MIEFPMFYFSRPDTYTFLVSPDPIDGFIPSPMHTKGNTIYDKVRISEFMCSSGYTSQPGVELLQDVYYQTYRNELRAKNLYILDLNSYFMIVALSIIKISSLNAQAVIGGGISYGSNNNGIILGDTIKGLDGHQTSISNTHEHIRVMGIEDFYGLAWNYVDGVFTLNKKIYINTDIKNITQNPTISNYSSLGYIDTGISTCIADSEHKGWSWISDISYSSAFPSIMTPISVTYNNSGKSDPIGDAYQDASKYSDLTYLVLGGSVHFDTPEYTGFFTLNDYTNNSNPRSHNVGCLFQEF